VVETDLAVIQKEIQTDPEELVKTISFADVDEGNIYAAYIYKLAKEGVVVGDADGNFRPDDFLNRAELLKIAFNAFKLETPATISQKPFTDIPLDAWFSPFVAAAKEQGIVNGYANGKFLPAQTVSRVEAIKILFLASGLELPPPPRQTIFTDVPLDAWYAPFVAFVEGHGISEGTTKSVQGLNLNYKVFQPNEKISRVEAVKVVVELANILTVQQSTQVSFWQGLTPKNLFSNVIKIFE
jgi:hypothetical protein